MYGLKERYRSKWTKSTRREYLVLWVLNHFYELPSRGFIAAITGLGAGVDYYLPSSWRSIEDAYDITVYEIKSRNIAALVDATGVSSPRELQPNKGLCVGAWKIWKAERLKLNKHKIWIVHIEDDGPRLRWIQLSVIENSGEEHRLKHDENPYLCLQAQKWKPTKHFINWLIGKTAKKKK